MRSFPFFADLSEKHRGPESNIKASWVMKFFSVILASYQEILSPPFELPVDGLQGKAHHSSIALGWVGFLNQSQRSSQMTMGIQCP